MEETYTVVYTRLNATTVKARLTLNTTSTASTLSLPTSIPIVVFDISSSMAGSRFNKCKNVIEKMIERVGAVQLVTYNDTAQWHGVVKTIPSSIYPTNRTGFRAAFQCVYKNHVRLPCGSIQSNNQLTQIIFMTDGEDTVDGSGITLPMAQFKEQLCQSGRSYVIHTMGIESDAHTAFLLDLAQSGTVAGTFGYFSKNVTDSYEDEATRLVNLLISQSTVIQFRDKSYTLYAHQPSLDVYFEDAIMECPLSLDQRDEIDYLAHQINTLIASLDKVKPEQILQLRQEAERIFNDAGKQPRVVRKSIRQQLEPIHAIIRQCYEILHTNMTLTHETLAKLNVAAREVRTTRFTKISVDRMDKNQAMMKKEDDAIATLAQQWTKEEMDDPWLKDVQVGLCILSQSSPLELLKDSDCLGIGLRARGDEVCIVDPTRLKIEAVSVSCFGCDAFLDAALYHVSHHAQQLQYGQPSAVVKDGANQLVSGVLPLYLNATHWKMARLYLKRMSSHLCCMDPYLGTNAMVFYAYLHALQFLNQQSGDYYQRMSKLLLKTLEIIYQEEMPHIIPTVDKFMTRVDQRVSSVVPSLKMLSFAYNVVCPNVLNSMKDEDKLRMMHYVMEEAERRQNKQSDWVLADVLTNLDENIWVKPYVQSKLTKESNCTIDVTSKMNEMIESIRAQDADAANHVEHYVITSQQNLTLVSSNMEVDPSNTIESPPLLISQFVPELNSRHECQTLFPSYTPTRRAVIALQLHQASSESIYVQQYRDWHVASEASVEAYWNEYCRDHLTLLRQNRLSECLKTIQVDEYTQLIDYMKKNDQLTLLERVALLHGTCYTGINISKFYTTVTNVEHTKMLFYGAYDIGPLVNYTKPIIVRTVMDKRRQFTGLFWVPKENFRKRMEPEWKHLLYTPCDPLILQSSTPPEQETLHPI